MLTYRTFVTDNDQPWCWACGRDAYQRTENWYGRWFLHRAHIGCGSGSMFRRDDSRAIILLCPRCHDLHCKLDFKVINGVSYPCLSNANAIWLKITHDPEHYDPDFLTQVWIGRPPDPEPVRAFYEQEYAAFRGARQAVEAE